MRTLAVVAAFLLTFSMSAAAQTYVQGYVRKDGTYVQGHYRSAPDNNPYNNYSYPGNTNPYTGKTATGNTDTYLQRYYDRSNNSSLGGYAPPSSRPSYTAPSYTYTAPSYTYSAPSYTAPSYTVPSYPGYESPYSSGWLSADE